MKKDLDQLLAEYKLHGTKGAPLELEQKSSTIQKEMSWKERVQLVLEAFEENNNTISQKDLANAIERFGFANNEEGRIYFRNFISWFLQQRIIQKKRIGAKLYYMKSPHVNSRSIPEYLQLIDRRTEQKTAKSETPDDTFKKRVSLLVRLLEELKTIPLERLLNEHIGQLGFTSDIYGRSEAEQFLKSAIQKSLVLVVKHDSIDKLILPKDRDYFLQSSTTASDKTPVVLPTRRPRGRPRRIPASPSAEETISPTKTAATVDTPRPKQVLTAPDTTVQLRVHLELQQLKGDYDRRMDALDDQVEQLVHQRQAIRRQLSRLETVISALFANVVGE